MKSNQTRLRVLLMAGALPSPNQGGPGRMVIEILRASEETNCPDVEVLALLDRYLVTGAESATTLQERVLSTQHPGPVSEYWRGLKKTVVGFVPDITVYGQSKYVLSKALAVRKALGAVKPDVIHSHEFNTAYVASRLSAGTPLIFTSHHKGSGVTEALIAPNPQFEGTLLERHLRHTERAAFQKATIVTFPSRGAVKLLEAEYPTLLKSKDVRIVYNGIDISAIDAVSPLDSLRVKYDLEGKRLLISVANFVPEKGHRYLIDALAQLNVKMKYDIRVLLIGQGHLRSEIEQQILENELEQVVTLAGPLSHSEVLQLLKMSYAFVLPSLVSVFDLVLLEAMAAGVPIITTSVGGNLEMLDKECSLLVPPSDTHALTRAIETILDDSLHGSAIAGRARKRVIKKFSLAAMLSEYVSIYEELGNRKGK